MLAHALSEALEWRAGFRSWWCEPVGRHAPPPGRTYAGGYCRAATLHLRGEDVIDSSPSIVVGVPHRAVASTACPTRVFRNGLGTYSTVSRPPSFVFRRTTHGDLLIAPESSDYRHSNRSSIVTTCAKTSLYSFRLRPNVEMSVWWTATFGERCSNKSFCLRSSGR